MSKKTADSKEDPLVIRLNAVISLLAQGNDMRVRQSILSLSNVGLRPIEIAKILGKSETYVNKELSLARKQSRERRPKK